MGERPRRRDDRPPMVVAMEWVSRITTVGLEMALPAALGYWLDDRWGTGPWLLVLGTVVGFAAGMYQLFRMAEQMDRRDRPPEDNQRDDRR